MLELELELLETGYVARADVARPSAIDAENFILSL